MALEVMQVPAVLVPRLTKADLENASFYDLLRERFGIVIGSATQTFEPTVTDEEESALLDVPVRSPAFLFERISRSDAGQTVEFARSIYRGDRYRFVAELLPQAGTTRRLRALGARADAGTARAHRRRAAATS